jgi:Tfp pilus assembly protein PilZ
VFEKGDTVLVHLALPTGYETLSESIMGEVVWVTPLPRRGDYGVGIRFDEMEKKKPRLYKHIKFLEGAASSLSPLID